MLSSVSESFGLLRWDLGYMVSAPGVSVDLEKVEVVMRWKRPNVNLRDT